MANPTPVQTYYVPVREDDTVLAGSDQGHVEIGKGTSLQDVDTFSLISFGIAAENTIVTYDNWEDGYEINAADPQQVDGAGAATTYVWGDGDASNNGVYIEALDKNNDGTVSDAEDVFVGGEAFNISDFVRLDRNEGDLYFDASDKISATFPISVSRLSAPIENSNDADPNNDSIRNIATGAVEVQDTSKFGSQYIIPVGGDGSGNTDAPTGAFDLAFAHVMAAQNGTSVYLNGTLVATLDEGETYVAAEVTEGDEITTYDPASASDGPGVQVTLITRDNGSEDNEQRWYSLSPVEDWSNDYVTPVGVGVNFDASSSSDNQGASSVWLYNGGDTAIDVTMQTRNPSSGALQSTVITVGAGQSVESPEIPDGSGARFTSDAGEPFYAVLQVDSRGNGVRNDWGHPLIPVEELTSQGLITFGYGNTAQLTDQNSGESRSLTFVTPLEDATIYVDFDGDGAVDAQYQAKALQSVTITDPADVNMTGALLYATDAAGDPVDIAIAHGQDPGQSAPESQSIDAGVVTIPLPEVFTSKAISLVDDADGNGVFSTGDTVEFTISTLNFGRVDIAEGGYVVTDDFFSFASVVDYVGGSTTYDLSDGRGQIVLPDSAGGTPFPLDEGFATTGRGDGSADSATLNVDETHTLTFRGTIKDFADLPAGTAGFVNEGELTNNSGGNLNDFSASAPLVFDTGVAVEKTTNGVDADTGTGPTLALGSSVVWRYAVSNTGETFLSDVEVSDDQGEVPLYVSGDANGNDLLDPGEVWLYEATGAAEPGQYRNIGTVTATPTYADGTKVAPSAGGGTVKASDPSAYFGLDKPSIALEKSVTDVAGRGPGSTVKAAGEVVTYELVVTNDGPVALTNVVVKDALAGFETTVASLAPGASKTFEVSYTATQDDIDTNGGGDGDIDNVATADSDQTAIVSDDAEVDLVQTPAIGIVKTADVASVDAAGDTIDYTYAVTNEGNVALANVTVKDDNATPGDTRDDFVADYVSGDTDKDGFLDVDETWLFGETVTVTQAQIDAGEDLTNTAVASADGARPAEDDATVTIAGSPALAIDKTVLSVDSAGDGVANAAGDVINYRITVTNTGATTLTNVVVIDPLVGLETEIAALAPGASRRFDVDYTITEDDIATAGGGDGDIDNTATADSTETDAVSDSEEVPLAIRPDLCTDIKDLFELPKKSDATIRLGEGLPHQNGTNDDDVIIGDKTDNTISTNGGENTVRGRNGDDLVNGGNEGDLVFGEGGKDTINGNGGDDMLSGGNNHDKIYGGGGNDKILGGGGADLVEAGDGKDRIHLGRGDDTVQGEGGDDCIRGGTDNGYVKSTDPKLKVKVGDEIWGNGGADKFEYVAGDGFDFLFDFKAEDGDMLHLFGLAEDDLSFVKANTQYGRFAGLGIDTDHDGELDGGIFFQQIRNPDDVEALIDSGVIELFV